MMSQTYVREEAPAAPLPLATFKPGAAFSLALLVFIVGAAWLSVSLLNPPAAAPATAAPGEFSSARALRHTEVIAARPHPVGSAAHAAVRDYLVEQLTAAGLRPEVQRSAAVNADTYGPLRAGQVENVVARLEGTANSKSVLLVGHYDSVPTGNGASDDGAAVGAMLETLRALQSGPPLKNDVIFLFTRRRRGRDCSARRRSWTSTRWRRTSGWCSTSRRAGTAARPSCSRRATATAGSSGSSHRPRPSRSATRSRTRSTGACRTTRTCRSSSARATPG